MRNGREVKGRDRDIYVGEMATELLGIFRFIKVFDYIRISKWKNEKENHRKEMGKMNVLVFAKKNFDIFFM